MLTELKLSNFRVFDDEVTVRFRPITVLIGRNSSGKSSIIKFLLMLQQSAAPGQEQFLNPEGDRVRLGVFTGLKNSLTRKRNFTFELTLNRNPRNPDASFEEKFLPVLPEGTETSSLLYKARVAASYSRKNNTGRVVYSIVDETSLNNYQRFTGKISTWSNFLDSSMMIPLPPNSESERENYQKSLNRMFSEANIKGVIRNQVNSISHLLPVRNESQRVIVASSPPFDTVGQMGEHTLPHLQRMTAENRDNYQFILPYLKSVSDLQEINFRNPSSYVSQAFAKNRTTGADVLIADFGFGVSQCLPILVQGAIMAPRTTLMVEQPEAQLHPTAQLELGSFFADLWTKRQVGSIIETHSDNILLRLRRLIARGDLSHEDVSVAYFTFDEANGNMPVIKNLDINEDGTMQPGLPMEFFGADIFEGLQLGARA